MTKNSRLYICTKCDTQYPAWQGRCSQCEAWGTIMEEHAPAPAAKRSAGKAGSSVDLSAVRGFDLPYRPTGVPEFDRVLSGGLVNGSLTLLGGSPGVGKSTLVLQVAAGVAARGLFLYISGEESKEQLKLRYDRLKLATKNIHVLTETDVGTIVATIEKIKPTLAIVDSVQTMSVAELPGEAGSVTQIKAATVMLLEAAKTSGTSVILVGHVTKEGVVAGPKTLEHLVDTVLYLEGDDTRSFRLLRSVKHRFGVTDEVGVFAMTERGLETVKNPSQLFLMEQPMNVAGTAVTAVLEGSRSFLVEVQALVSSTSFGYPRRLASGFELGRLELIIAVLIRRAGLKLANQDVHINLVGGLRVREPAIDLAVALAIASGFSNVPLPPKTVIIGELGLGGEVRPVARLQQRLGEAQKLGYLHAIVPTMPSKGEKLKIAAVRTVQEALRFVSQ